MFGRELTYFLLIFSGAKIIDATDKFIVPGGIDSSTNLRAGEDLADDMNSGTRYGMVSQKKHEISYFSRKKIRYWFIFGIKLLNFEIFKTYCIKNH